MAFPSLLALAITLSILSTAAYSQPTATGATFTIDLIHRDSIKSPFYDGGMTFSQRRSHALQRSFINAKRLHTNNDLNSSTYQTEIIPDHGEFLLNISYGNPSHKVLAIADTGSDLSWIQCKPCIQCYKHQGSLFNPNKSSTYKPVECESTTCKSVSIIETNCSTSENCQFYESYADGSFSNGTVSTETVTIGDQVLPNIVFGCGFNNAGVFRRTWGGIVGLGGGDYSFVSQIRSYVAGKFSYCLIPFPLDDDDFPDKSSKMIFGDIDFGPNIVSTPIVQISPKTYYHVTLEGMSVGETRFNIAETLTSSKPLHKGNMIVDSGTTLTMLPKKLYEEVEAAVMYSLKLRTMKDPQRVLNLCYRGAKVKNIPKVTMHFEGADVELKRENIFVTTSKHIICFAFAPTTDIAVYGNLAQMNFMVGYNLENNRISFKPADCEKL